MFSTIAKAMTAVALLSAPVSAIADTVTENFNNGLPEGWVKVGAINIDSDRARSGKGVWSSEKKDDKNYVVTTPLQDEVSFYARTYNTKSNGYVIFYSVNDDNTLGAYLGEISTGYTSSGSISFKSYSFTVPSPQRIAIALNYSAIDDFTYTPVETVDGPALTVVGFENGSTYDFGGIPVSAGTSQSFTLANPGNQTLTVSSITVTGGYSITEGADIREIGAGKSATVVVETPDEDAEGVLSIVSDDAEGTYTINLKSTWKVPAPAMVLDVESITFGKVTGNAEQTVTVSNTGDATLAVEIGSSSADFSVDPAELTVEPGENDTFTVTYNYDASSVGAHSAAITLRSNAGDDVIIAASAIVRDPNVWREDFSSNTLPAGWDYGANWSFTDGVARAQYKYGSTGYLTTPELVAATGDELSFCYKTTGYYVDIVIEASVDGSDFKEIKKISQNYAMQEFEEYTISGLNEGVYQFRFKNDSYDLDDFEGLKLLDKDHNLSIVAAVIPTKGTQYLEYAAGVEVRELNGRDEDITATLYINGIAVAAEDTTVEAGSTAEIALVFTPQEAMENATARIVVNYAGAEVSSDDVTVNIQAATVFDEENTSEIPVGHLDAVKINYRANNGWNIISFPFALSDEILSMIFGDDFTSYGFEKVDDGNIYLREVSGEYAAGYAYVVNAHDVPANDEGIVLSDISIIFNYPRYDEWSGICLQAHFAPLTPGETACYILSDDVSEEAAILLQESPKLQKIDSQNGFRGYFTIPEPSAKVPDVVLVDAEGNVSGIVSIEAITGSSDDIYNLNGQKVSNPAAGIYIIGGKKTVIK